MFKAIKNSKSLYLSLLALGGPIFVANAGVILTGIVDTIMVAQHSTEELAASAFVNNVINAFLTLGTGFSYGIMPMIGEQRANNNFRAIGGWLKNSVWANVTTMLLMMVGLGIIYLNIENLGQPNDLIPLIKPYYIVIFISIAFLMVVNSFRRFFDGIAHPQISMWILTICNLLNVLGNYILIYGKFGMPELGLWGAGLSTLFSRLLMLFSYIGIFMFCSIYKDYLKGFIENSFRKRNWKKLNVIGWPIGFQQGVESATFCVTAIMIGWLGSSCLAAHQVMITISMFCMSIYMGIGSAVTINVSYAKGAKNWDMVKKNVHAGLHLVLLFATIICLFLFFSKEHIGRMFTDDGAVNDIICTLFPILFLYQIGDSLLIVLSNALRGLADVKVIMWISFLSYFVLALPLGYFCGFVLDWGISGLWLSYPIGFACSSVLLGLRFRRLMKVH